MATGIARLSHPPLKAAPIRDSLQALAPGDYTIEATTYRRGVTGDFTLTVRRTAPAPSFTLSPRTSTTSVKAGETFDLTVRMHNITGSGEHGGISVSFPAA